MRATFNRLADEELNEAIQFYEREQPGLGRAFLSEVRRTVGALCEFPEAGPLILGSIRRRICHRFPYALIYEVRGDEIRILAVMNQKRRPNYWVDRS